jgi:hypothetical protein
MQQEHTNTNTLDDAVATAHYSIDNCVCPVDIISGSLITMDKRHELFGQISGGAGACKPEKYQRTNIENGTGLKCSKTNIRINLRTQTLKDVAHPNKLNTGFDYTENFDGVQMISGSVPVYINFKSIVGKGGGQTRSLREVYWFIYGQMQVLTRISRESESRVEKMDVYFANILDGNEAHAAMPKFEYLTSLPEFNGLPFIKNNIYIGDLKGYFEWFKSAWLAQNPVMDSDVQCHHSPAAE